MTTAPLTEAVGALLDRDLRTLRRELEAYPDEHSLWQTIPGVSNVAGTLALHLTGNLQYYLGAVFGRTGYIRDRPAEFARRHVPRSELLGEIDAARSAVKAGLSRIGEAQLKADFPEVVGGARVNTGEYLVHLATHFAYHLGQVDYHRRVVTGNPAGVDAVRPGELGSARESTP